MRAATLVAAVALAGVAVDARAQSAAPSQTAGPMQGMDMSGMGDMPGMRMPQHTPAAHPRRAATHRDAGRLSPRAGDRAAAAVVAPAGTDLAAGNAAPPPPPTDLYAAATYGAAAMAASHAAMMRDSGGQRVSMVMVNLAEWQGGDGHPSLRWDGEGWWGGDLDRLVVKSEGRELLAGQRLDDGEADAFYSRAITRYFDLQGGIRQDLGAPNRTYLAAAVEGLAPYWFETEATLFVATTGTVLGRLEGWHDSYLTQRLVLQPRVELNFADRDDRRAGQGAGLSQSELGVRLRYEFTRQLAPYMGVSWTDMPGDAGRFAHRDGGQGSAMQMVLGLRTFF